MSALMTMSTICIFCFMVVGHETSSLHSLSSLVVVMCVCIFHCKDGTELIPR